MEIFKHLFGTVKKEQLTNQETTVAVSKTRYSTEIEQIHHEFETAADRLLEQANLTLEEAAKADVVKVSRLQKLGFKQVQQVTETVPLIQKAELSKEQIELLNYYRREYPLNKFIVESQVQEICHKYNLVCGDVSRYKGFVPEKNLREIEKFKLKTKEAQALNIKAYKNGSFIGTFTAQSYEVKRSGGYYHIFFPHWKNDDVYAFQQSSKELAEKGEFYGSDSYDMLGLQDLGFLTVQIEGKILQICAPVKDMDISGLELENGYKLTKNHIPDPVVLQPVKGGYLILTAWGDEASDPIVRNEINN